MAIASGVAKKLGYKVESVWNTAAGASGGAYTRRVTTDINLTKNTYESAEMRTDYQVADFRHGGSTVSGTIKGELSALTYQPFIAAALRRDFTAVSSLTSLSLTIAGTGPTYTVTRGSGNFITGGLKVGMVVTLSAAGLNAANSAKNLFIIALTDTVATVIPANGVAMVAEGPIASCTLAIPGKYTYVPATSHTNQSFTIEDWQSDISKGRLFTGCRINSLAFGLPSTGMATIDVGIMGGNMTTTTAQYFSSPSAASSTGVMAAVNGILRIGSAAVANVTGMTINVAGGYTTGTVVGSNYTPDVFAGRVKVSGQLTAYLADNTFVDAFANETTLSMTALLTSSSDAAADTISISVPKIKLGGATFSDGEQGIQVTSPFTAIYNSDGSSSVNSEPTTISIQDSEAV